MDRNTVVRIAIPLSLYESVKGKVIKENENASGWQIYSSEGKYPNIKYEPVNDKVYKTEDEAKHIASIINKQYPNSRVYVKPAGSIDEAKKAAEKKAADIKETKEPKEKKSSEDAELIAKMEKMAKGSDPGKAYAAELFLKTLKKKK
jgi:hypothetical protein